MCGLFVFNAIERNKNAVQKYFAQDASYKARQRPESIKIERISDK